MIGLPAALELRVRRPSALGPDDVEALWQLMSRSVVRDRAEFEARLAGCDEIHTVHERDGGAPVALLAVHLVPARRGRRTVTVLHAQWAFALPRWRGRNLFLPVGARLFLRLRLRSPVLLLYSAATLNSFLMISRRAKWFWCGPQRDFPPALQGVVGAAMERIAGEDWDPEAGVLRGRGRWRYREGVVRADRVSSVPDVERYRRLNPGQADGDALVCLAPMTLLNWAVGLGRLAARHLRRRGPWRRRFGVSSKRAMTR